MGGLISSSSSSPHHPTKLELADARKQFERRTLEELYASTGGANWREKDGWLSEAPVGRWRGITTDGDGFVTQIDLSGNQLSGKRRDFLLLRTLSPLLLQSAAAGGFSS